MRKKLIALILMAVIISTGVINFSSADISTTIESKYAKQGNASAQQWYSSGENRALLTVLLAADVFPNMKQFDTQDMVSFLTNSSYVGISSNSRQLLVIGYYGSTNIIPIVFTPSSNEIQYMVIEMSGSKLSDSAIDDIMLSTLKTIGNTKDYSKNNNSMVTEQMNKIMNFE